MGLWIEDSEFVGWSGVVGLEWFARSCSMAFVVFACWSLWKMVFCGDDNGEDCPIACGVSVRTYVIGGDDDMGLVAVGDGLEMMFCVN